MQQTTQTDSYTPSSYTPSKSISTTEAKDFLQRLSKIDFGPIAFKLMHPDEGEGWEIERTTQAIEAYRQFLFLSAKYPTQRIVPSREVDLVWHTHILDTAKYREDCNLLFGKFIDHWPYFGMNSEAEKQASEQAFATTQALAKKHFGKTI